MKKSNKAVSLALVMLMLLSSCAGGNENNVETLPSTDTTKPVVTEDTTAASESESETEEERILPDIPASADYGDDEVLFLVWDRAGWAALSGDAAEAGGGLGKGTAILEGATECSLNSSICCGRRMA